MLELSHLDSSFNPIVGQSVPVKHGAFGFIAQNVLCKSLVGGSTMFEPFMNVLPCFQVVGQFPLSEDCGGAITVLV